MEEKKQPATPAWYVNLSLVVLTTMLACRLVYSYYWYILTHGHTATSRIVSLLVIVFGVGMIFVIKRSIAHGVLVTKGPFRLIAHPTYLIYLLLDVPLWFIVPIDRYALITAPTFYVALLITAYLEERDLMNRYGEGARSYYGKTPSVHYVLWRCLRLAKA